MTVATGTEKKLTFTLEPGQERYVRLCIQMGVFVGRIVPGLGNKATRKDPPQRVTHAREDDNPRTASTIHTRPSSSQTRRRERALI